MERFFRAPCSKETNRSHLSGHNAGKVHKSKVHRFVSEALRYAKSRSSKKMSASSMATAQ